MGHVLDQLLSLHPRSFENCMYDLLVRRGMQNVVWRTPGADGGRDIEGSYSSIDFSGLTVIEEWYVECKRYQGSVDWPTVFEKLAYAENHAADFLLICTTGTLSPKCRDELSRRDGRGLKPFVRAWEGHDLEAMLSRDDILLAKYGLGPSPSEEGPPVALLWAAAKAVQDAYGQASMTGRIASSLELSAALTELALICAEDLRLRPNVRHAFEPPRDLYEWCQAPDLDAELRAFDAYGLRAALCVVRHATSSEQLSLSAIARDEVPAGMAGAIRLNPAPNEGALAARAALDAIAIVCDMEWSFARNGLRLLAREGVREEREHVRKAKALVPAAKPALVLSGAASTSDVGGALSLSRAHPEESIAPSASTIPSSSQAGAGSPIARVSEDQERRAFPVDTTLVSNFTHQIINPLNGVVVTSPHF